MENTKIRIQKYFEGNLTAEAKDRLEQDLRRNKSFMKEFILYSIQGDVPEMTADQLQFREQMAEKFANDDPLPEPKLSWRFYVQNFWYSSARNWVIGGVAIFAGMFIFMKVLLENSAPLPPLTAVIQEYIQDASCENRAGSVQENQKNNFHRSSQIYCPTKLDKKPFQVLQALEVLEDSCQSEFCMSCYYLAHVKLENQQYEEAIQLFQRCLSSAGLAEILKYPYTFKSEPKIRFNLILAELGAGKPVGQGMAKLKDLLGKTPMKWDLHQKEEKLLEVLNKYN